LSLFQTLMFPRQGRVTIPSEWRIVYLSAQET
jgi:hypothetical protein